MPRVCTICNHTDRQPIESALLKGDPLRGISALYRVSEDALARHRDKHLPEKLAQATQAAVLADANNLLDQVRNLQSRALTILSQAEQAGDLRTALQAIREARGNLELLARLVGELQDNQTVNLLVSPDWLQLRNLILRALQDFPDARLSVARATISSWRWRLPVGTASDLGEV